MGKRVFIIVCDSLGIGNAPDADLFGDRGTSTLRALASSSCFDVPELERLGLFNIEGVDFREGYPSAQASYARAVERSMGKDSTIGHWEISGIISGKGAIVNTSVPKSDRILALSTCIEPVSSNRLLVFCYIYD